MNAILGRMRARRWAEAEVLLRDALDRDEGPRGPLLGMLSQALFEQGRLGAAKNACRQAMRVARSQSDVRGLEQLRALNGQIYARLAERTVSVDARQLEGVELLLHRAQALEGAAAAAVAMEALDQAESVRERVLCRLALLRAEPHRAEEHLRAAHALADEHEEPQLVAAIAKAARAAGVDFGTHRF